MILLGKSSQVKGRRAELELVRLFQSHGIPAEAGQAVSYGTTPDIVGVDGVHVEVKRRENVNLSAALEQAQRDSERFGGLPAVFHRKNREKWRVTMTFDSWISLYKRAFPGVSGRSEPPGKERGIE